MNIHLITMDQMDVHWVKLEKAAKAKVEELTAAGEAVGKKLLEELEAAEIKEGKIGIVSAQAGVQSCIDRVSKPPLSCLKAKS